MKATGIVRRIDDLGRVVIPKEIRRTLRIREGDPLEIFTDSDGEVIFKKYSPIGEMSSFAEQYAEVLGKVSKRPILICDTDHIIAASGIPKKEVLERRISSVLEEYMEARKTFIASENNTEKLLPMENVDKSASLMYPIISAGDLAGAVIMLFDEKRALPTESEIKLIQAASAFLSKHIE